MTNNLKNETATNCHQLKLQATDGKLRLTDIAYSPFVQVPLAQLQNIHFYKYRLQKHTFKRIDFDAFRNQAELHSFSLTPKEWVQNTMQMSKDI